MEDEEIDQEIVVPRTVTIPADSKKLIAEKKIRLKDTLKEMNKGMALDGAVTKKAGIDYASSHIYPAVERIPSGVFPFDVCTFGGIPIGRITEFYGDESSSKTTMALRVVGQAQKMGMMCAWIDVENTHDPKWAERFVCLDDMLLSQPESGEEAMEVVDGLIRSGSTDLIIVDSIAAMTPQAEIDKAFDEATMGALARLVNKAMRKWVSSINYASRMYDVRPTIIQIQQLRQKIGVMFGNPDVTPGGKGQNFAKSLSVKMWHGKTAEDKATGKPYAIDMNLRVSKSKVCPSGMSGTYTMMIRDTEFKNVGDVFDEEQIRKLLLKYEFIEKVGGKYEIKDPTPGTESLFVSKLEDIDIAMLKNPHIADAYRKDLLEFLINL